MDRNSTRLRLPLQEQGRRSIGRWRAPLWAGIAVGGIVIVMLAVLNPHPLLLVPVLLMVLVAIQRQARRVQALRMELRATRIAAHEADARAASAGVAEAKLLAVIESVTEGIIQVSGSGRFIHANIAARALLHLPPRIEGQSVTALIRHPDLRLAIEQAVSRRSLDPLELAYEDRQLLVSAQPLQIPGGLAPDAAGAVISIVDLTEFRRLESVRRDFVANVSHELKTPLTSIRGYTETLLGDELTPALQRQFLEVVHKNAERIQRIIDDLLDLSRLQSGGWRPELQSTDVAALAHDVWSGCEAGHRKDIHFDVVANTTPVGEADPGGLRQVLSNLFDNAIRYTPENGRIDVVIERAVDDLLISVHDSGGGIPRESLPRIFERFYRVDPARSRAAGGTGLGLAIVRHLMERMGGDVSAESELGKGTTIRLRLPAVRED